MDSMRYGQPIVVDDGSKDDTSRIAANLGAVVICLGRNFGYDHALNCGFQKASELGMSYIITADGDGQHMLGYVPDFIKSLQGGADMVIGTRMTQPRISEKLFKLVAGFLWGIKDPLSGFKGYTKDIYENCGHFDSYKSIGTELLLFCASSNKKIVQIPIRVKARSDRSRFGNLFSTNIKVFRALVFGIYLYYLFPKLPKK